MSKFILKSALIGAAAVATLGAGLTTTSTPAQAQNVIFKGGHGGFVGGHRGFVGHRGYVGHRGFVGHRGYYGPRYGYGYGYRPYRNNGGAVAAGLIGGLALGAIASNSYNYGYAPVGYGYAPSYGYGYAPVSYGYGGCTIERRVRVNRFGERVIRDVQVCN
jgi:hypothetical protein